MKDRLIEFLRYLSIGQNKFEANVGLSIGYINKLGSSMNIDTFDKILQRYPELNGNWLKTGEGEMLKGNENISVAGNGNNAANANVSEMIEVVKESQVQMGRLIAIIEDLHKKI